MITTVKSNTTYELIDKNGYFEINPNNEARFNRYFNTQRNQVIIDTKLDGMGLCASAVIISENTYKFFKEIL